MPRQKKPTPERRQALARDLLDGQADLLTLLDRHGLDPEQVRDWMADTADTESLRSLVQLADLQAQLMLSRFRLSAVMRLIALANDDDPKQREPARRACVDLLKAQLDATATKQVSTKTREPDPHAPDLRALLFGDLPDAAKGRAKPA
ncbi:MAG: hypothetical protein AAGB29_02870 [Planctomycetota bacterium]